MSVELLEIPLPPPPPTTVRTQIQLQKKRCCCRQKGKGIKINKWVIEAGKNYEEEEEEEYGEACSFSASFTAIDLIRAWCSLPPPLAPHPFTIEQTATAARGSGVTKQVMVWWSWTNPQPNPNERDIVVMEGLTEEEMHAREFAQLLQRCLMVDNLSFTITDAILCAALGQFGTVQSIKLLRDPKNPGKCIGTAIVEMETAQQADVIVKQMQEFMFMVGGMPRPVRAYKATEAMFIDHPLRRRKSLELRFLTRGEPGAREAFQKREIAERHAFERNYIQQQQRIAEEELAMKQFENFQELRKKYESIKDNKEIDMLRQLYKLPDRVR